jgi:hypothetical protein
MTPTIAPDRLVLEKPLPKYGKTLMVEFEDKKFVKASVDGEELTPSKFKPRIGNVMVNEPAVEIAEASSYCIRILDSQGTWWLGYPAGTKCP